MIAEISGSFVQTWTHPSFHEIANTVLSLDHICAEFTMELITAIPAYFLGKRAVRRHDRTHHFDPIWANRPKRRLHATSRNVR
jgi:hypothetical protein